MGVEEQKEEREVLDSIFPDEITDVSDTSYRISISLDIPGDNSEDDSEPPAIVLSVTYPDKYPDVGPHLDISAPPDGTRHPLLDVSEDKTQLLESLQPIIEDSLGMAMVFTLVTTLKEAAETLIIDRQRQAEEVRETAAREKEEEENRKFHGTLVNRERFLEWQDKFRKEMEEKARLQKEEEEADDKKKRGGKPDERKLTGRELWEKGLIGKVDDEDAETDDVGAGVEKLKIDS